MSGPDVDADALQGAWVHSHEEDADGVQVWRRPEWPFPPSRGRRRLDLGAGGRAQDTRPGPDDRPLPRAGAWRLSGRALDVITPEGARQRFTVVDVEPRRLALRPTA